ncbi:hypothetical protein [Halalkalicoccus jeotgali]|nr:hypothetical protein [Halalkalicoccus jeotgali]
MTATADATDSSTVEALAQTVEELQETVNEQAERIEQQAEKIEQLETEIDVQSSNVGGCHSRVSDLTERVDDLEDSHTQPDPMGTTAGDGGGTDAQNGQTPLERICGLPEHIVDRELTANQKRARFLAKDVRDYAEKVPAGLFMDSQTITKVIAAAEGKKPHTQTVARVMDFLDDLGKDDIKVKKRQGKKFVVVDPEAADRYHSRCDRGDGKTPSERVIGTV